MSKRVGYALTISGGLFVGAVHGATMFAGIALAVAGLFVILDAEPKDEQLD
jgi:hypothetical protein